jgi:ElaB/YqjD/DUF883 family membrane-anchored ribosome-binding protein
MTEEQPTQSEPQGNDIANELRDLGLHLKEMLRTAWESPERNKVQEEIQSGLTELGDTINKAVGEFSESPTGQTLKADMEDFSQRVHSGQVESKVREEILKVLRLVNDELGKAGKASETPAEETAQQSDSGGAEEG